MATLASLSKRLRETLNNSLVKAQKAYENPTRIKTPRFDETKMRSIPLNAASGFAESLINEPISIVKDVGTGVGKAITGDLNNFNPTSNTMRLTNNVIDSISTKQNPLSTVKLSGYGKGKWNVPFTGINLPEMGFSESPAAGMGKQAIGILEPFMAAKGATKPLAVAGYTALGSGANALLGDRKDSLEQRLIKGANTAAPDAAVSAGFLTKTNPFLDKIGGKAITRLPLKSGANVAQGVGLNELTGQENSGASVLLDALFPLAGELATKTFKSSQEAVRATEARLKSVLGKSIRNNKGMYTTAEKFAKGTRPYRKSGKYAQGGLLGFEPYQDEDGGWKVRFNRGRALLGLGITAGISKAGNLTDDVLKGVDGKQIDPLITEARKYKSAEEFVRAKTYTSNKADIEEFFKRDGDGHLFNSATVKANKKINKDGTIELVHLTTPEGKLGIEKEGFKEGTWFGLHNNRAISRPGSTPTVTMKIKVDPSDMAFGRYALNRSKLVKGADGVYRPEKVSQLTDIWNQANADKATGTIETGGIKNADNTFKGGVGDLADVKKRLSNIYILSDADKEIIAKATTPEELAPYLRKLDGGSLAKFFNSGNGQVKAGADPLITEARKYRSAEEFVKAQGQSVFRGGDTAIDTARGSGRGISVSDKETAGLFTPPEGGLVDEAILPKTVKILKEGDIPKNLQDAYIKEAQVLADPKNFSTALQKSVIEKQQAIIEYARKNGFDAVDFPFEKEIRVVKPNVLKTKSQLTDIWNQATKTTQSPELPKEVLQPQAKVPTVQTPVPQVAKQDVLQRGTEQTKQGLGLEPPKDTRAASLENIVRQSATPVKQKVSLVDYLRTPSHVLKKIGLEKQAEALKTAHNAYLDELPKEINKVTEWYKRAPSPESATNIFKHLDGQKVFLDPNETQVAKEIRGYLMNWADRLGLPKDSRITNYITHIFDEQLIQKEFDDDLAKIIQDNVAGSVYDPFTQQRLGALGYKENVWEALDAYVKRGVRKVNMDSALEQVKKAADSLEISQFNYVKRYVDRINMRPTEVDNLLDNTIKQMVGYRLGGRPTARISKTARQMVYRGTLGLNVGSALRNLTQAVNTYSELGEKYTVLGYTNLLKNGTKELDEVGIFRNSMVEDRALNATKKFWEKTDKVLFSFFELAERINRGSAYYGAKAKGLSKGMTEDQARKYATGIVEKTQFTFGKIDTPVAMQSDIVKLLTQFQSYNMKQLEFLGGKVKARDVAGLARYSIGSFVMLQTIGQLLGMDWKDLIPSIKIGASPVFTGTRDIIQSITGGEDDYGNELSPDDRAKMAGKAVLPFIPAGVQTRKTVGGILDLNRGYTQTKSGNVRTPLNATPSNWLRGVTFGSNTLPEVQEHWDNDTKALSEKQSQEFRTTSDRKGYYESVLQGREDNKESQAARERVAQTGKEELSNGKLFYMGNETDSKTGEVKKAVKSLTIGDIEQTNRKTGLGKYVITTENGNKALIDLTKPLEKPEATGRTELDKELISRYNSSITTRINNIEKVYLDGQMTAGEAEKAISDLKAQKITAGKAKKKGVKVSLPKITLSTSPISKSKIRPTGTIKLKKAPKLKLKAAKPASIKLAKKNYSKGKPIKFKNTLSDSLTKLV